MDMLSIYDARKLKLSENDPLFRVLYHAYICHTEIREDVARKAASSLSSTIQVDEAIKLAEEELNV